MRDTFRHFLNGVITSIISMTMLVAVVCCYMAIVNEELHMTNIYDGTSNVYREEVQISERQHTKKFNVLPGDVVNVISYF